MQGIVGCCYIYMGCWQWQNWNHPVFHTVEVLVLRQNLYVIYIYRVDFRTHHCFWLDMIGIVYVLRLNFCVVISAGGLWAPEDFYSLEAKYFGTGLKYDYKLNCPEKSRFYKFISKRRNISLMHCFILPTYLAEFHDTVFGCFSYLALEQFTQILSRFPTFSAWVPLKRLYWSKCKFGASKLVSY
jgi:hypothetical protein